MNVNDSITPISVDITLGFGYSVLKRSIGVLSVGCTVGWTTPILKKLRKPGSVLPISESESSWLAAAHEVGHFLSPLPAGYAIGTVGRKVCLIVASVFTVCGWILVLSTRSVPMLYFVRFLFGISMGIVFTTVPLYIAEVAPSKTRGALSTLFQAMLFMGHLIEFSAGPYVSYSTLGIITIAFAIFWLITSFFLKESPHFLVQKGRIVEATDNLSWLLKTKDDEILKTKIAAIDETIVKDHFGKASFQELFSPRYNRKLAVVILVAVFQRFAGMSAVVAYAATTFQNTDHFLDSDQYTILFGALIFSFTFVSASLIDCMGRRPLLLVSSIGCAIAHFVTGVYFVWIIPESNWIPFVSICAFSIMYSLGLGPIVNTLQGELFPPHIKGLASAFTTLCHAASSFAVTKLFQVVKDQAGIYVCFFVFSISCVLCSVFVFVMVPETKKKDLMETQRPM